MLLLLCIDINFMLEFIYNMKIQMHECLRYIFKYNFFLQPKNMTVRLTVLLSLSFP